MRTMDSEFYTNEPYKSSKIRRCKIMVLSGALSNYALFRELSVEKQNFIVRKIESACVNETIRKAKEDNIGCSWQTDEFVCRYGNLICEKAHELDFTENEWLVTRVVSGEIEPQKIATMSTDETNPEALRDMYARRTARLAAKVTIKWVTSHECPQCGVKMCQVRNVQLRGLDESKSTIATCECSFEWTLER